MNEILESAQWVLDNADKQTSPAELRRIIRGLVDMVPQTISGIAFAQQQAQPQSQANSATNRHTYADYFYNSMFGYPYPADVQAPQQQNWPSVCESTPNLGPFIPPNGYPRIEDR